MIDSLQKIQETIFNYFEDTPTSTLVSLIDIFVYHNKSNDEYVNKLLNEFLEENELTLIYTNYISDLYKKDGSKFFTKNSRSDNNLIDTINIALLSLAFNRLRELI